MIAFKSAASCVHEVEYIEHFNQSLPSFFFFNFRFVFIKLKRKYSNQKWHKSSHISRKSNRKTAKWLTIFMVHICIPATSYLVFKTIFELTKFDILKQNNNKQNHTIHKINSWCYVHKCDTRRVWKKSNYIKNKTKQKYRTK